MGILDDAIREHLKLKREHGAPQEEVERLEAEAFGQGGRPPPRLEQPVAELEESPEPAAAEAAGEGWDAQPEAVEVDDWTPEDEGEDRGAAVAASTEEWSPPDVEEGDEHPPEPPDPLPPESDDGEPEGDEREDDELESDEPEDDELEGDEPEDDELEGDELLEETPEFLQDSPESDRMWFDQRPPKDFDFDD